MKALSGRRIAVTRTNAQAKNLGTILLAAGAVVDYIPLIDVTILPAGDTELRQHLTATPVHDWIVVTSANGARAILQAGGLNSNSRLATIGPAATRVLEVVADFQPHEMQASGLLAKFESGPGRLLLVQGNLADQTLNKGLEKLGWTIDRIVAYSTTLVTPSVDQCARIAGADAVALYSPSAVAALIASNATIPRVVVTVGATTLDACPRSWIVDQAPLPTDESVAALLIGKLSE